jgi:hypothetical protein
LSRTKRIRSPGNFRSLAQKDFSTLSANSRHFAEPTSHNIRSA